MAKLSKAERKELIQEAEKERSEHPVKKTESGFATIDKEAEKLENEKQYPDRIHTKIPPRLNLAGFFAGVSFDQQVDVELNKKGAFFLGQWLLSPESLLSF